MSADRRMSAKKKPAQKGERKEGRGRLAEKKKETIFPAPERNSGSGPVFTKPARPTCDRTGRKLERRRGGRRSRYPRKNLRPIGGEAKSVRDSLVRSPGGRKVNFHFTRTQPIMEGLRPREHRVVYPPRIRRRRIQRLRPRWGEWLRTFFNFMERSSRFMSASGGPFPTARFDFQTRPV